MHYTDQNGRLNDGPEAAPVDENEARPELNTHLLARLRFWVVCGWLEAER